jgi:hypothetical protein
VDVVAGDPVVIPPFGSEERARLLGVDVVAGDLVVIPRQLEAAPDGGRGARRQSVTRV